MLFGRLHREFRRRNVSVYPLAKIRSASQSPLLQESVRKKLAHGLSVSFNHDASNVEEAPFKSVVQILWAIRIMTNGWSMAGTTLVQSKLKLGEQIRDCEAPAALWYQDFTSMQALAHPGPWHDTI
eukprot:5263560-Karenia_brevis.AAC.1